MKVNFCIILLLFLAVASNAYSTDSVKVFNDYLKSMKFDESKSDNKPYVVIYSEGCSSCYEGILNCLIERKDFKSYKIIVSGRTKIIPPRLKALLDQLNVKLYYDLKGIFYRNCFPALRSMIIRRINSKKISMIELSNPIDCIELWPLFE